MRSAVRFVVGLLLALVFCGAAVAAVSGTWILARDAVTSIGDPGAFEANMRHQTDRLTVAPDGTLTGIRVQYPVLQVIGSVVLSWLVALGSGLALQRLTRRGSSSTITP